MRFCENKNISLQSILVNVPAEDCSTWSTPASPAAPAERPRRARTGWSVHLASEEQKNSQNNTLTPWNTVTLTSRYILVRETLTCMWLPSATTTYSWGIRCGTPSCEMIYWTWNVTNELKRKNLIKTYLWIYNNKQEVVESTKWLLPQSPGCLLTSGAELSVHLRWLSAGCMCLPPG